MTCQPRTNRRAGVYIAVLGTALLVTLIGLAALAAVRVQRATATASMDLAKARLYAQSAVQLALQTMRSDGNWRNTRPAGVWIAGAPIDDGALRVEVTDPLDGNLANRSNDPVIVKGTGTKGQAQQIMQLTLAASGTPLDALSMALHTDGQLHINSNQTLTVTGAPASTNSTLRNEGTIAGSVHCLVATQLGTISGTLTMPAPAKAMPDPGLLSLYTALGTAIAPGNTLDRVVLAPGVNPWGAPNADGVYVINLSSNLTIRRSRIYGTLVINGNSRTVTIQDTMFMQPARADYPVIITDADLVLACSGANLSESAEGTNFNPAGAPYQGAADSDTSDQYPCEIQGLVHTRGELRLYQTTIVRGAIIAESNASSDAVRIDGAPQVLYTPTLTTSPPMGYTKTITMQPVPGSWTQVVNP
jgi:hypothetical protein